MKKALLHSLMPLLLAGVVVGCTTSGPQKVLDAQADALNKNDSTAFLAQMDLKTFAANQVKNMTRNDQALSTLDSMGRMLGLGGMDSLLGSVLDMEARLNKQYTRGVSTGELAAQCRAAATPDCPWVPESLRKAQVTELGQDAAVAKVTTPAGMTSWLALRKKGDRWLVVGQAMLEGTAREYAAQTAPQPEAGPQQAPAAPRTPGQGAPDRDAPAPDTPAPTPDNRADNQGVTKL